MTLMTNKREKQNKSKEIQKEKIAGSQKRNQKVDKLKTNLNIQTKK